MPLFPEWVFGILFRPAVTFEQGNQQLRLGYFWILLSVFTVEVVMALYAPTPDGMRPYTLSEALFATLLFLLILFDIQVLLFLGVARLSGWKLRMDEASKWIGLAWSVILVLDLVTFYPVLAGQDRLSYLIGIPFLVWYLISLAAGVRRVTRLPLWKAITLVLTASLPWQGLLLWLQWSSLPQ